MVTFCSAHLKKLSGVEMHYCNILHRTAVKSIQKKQLNFRVELWQAVHEFIRYFGNDSSDEVFVLAKEALHESTFTQYRENLASALAERNQEKLHHVLYEVSKACLFSYGYFIVEDF